jgi:hypothetical protein
MEIQARRSSARLVTAWGMSIGGREWELLVEDGEQGGEIDLDGCVGESENAFTLFGDGVSAEDVGGAGFGVEDPDFGDAHAEIVVGAGDFALESEAFGFYFDAQKGGFADDACALPGGGHDADVGDAEAGGSDLDTGFDEGSDAPVVSVRMEEGVQGTLHVCMIDLAHQPLLEDAVEVIHVGLRVAVQVLVDRNQRECRRSSHRCHLRLPSS